MRADRPLLALLTFVAVLALGYVAYAISAGVHPSPGATPSAATPGVRPPDRDLRDQ
jgi:hypothetical protein